jgi:hypothetical protein
MRGHVNTVDASTPKPYFEENDYFGYDVDDTLTLGGTFTGNVFESIHYANSYVTEPGGHQYGLYKGYIAVPGHAAVKVATAWLNDYHHTNPIAELEAVNFTDTTGTKTKKDCPSMGATKKPVYFGTNGSGSGGATWSLYWYSRTTVWTRWPTSSDYVHARAYTNKLVTFHTTSNAAKPYVVSQITQGAYKVYKT